MENSSKHLFYYCRGEDRGRAGGDAEARGDAVKTAGGDAEARGMRELVVKNTVNPNTSQVPNMLFRPDSEIGILPHSGTQTMSC